MRWVIIQGSGWENVLSYPLPSLVPGPISYYHCETILSNATLDYKCLAKKLLEGIDMSLSGLQTGPVFPSPSKSDASLPLAIICLLSGLSPLFSWRGGVPSFFFLPHKTGRKGGPQSAFQTWDSAVLGELAAWQQFHFSNFCKYRK